MDHNKAQLGKTALTGKHSVRTSEEAFDRQTDYKREQTESFLYCHAVKKGRVAAIREQARLRVEQEQRQLEKAQQHQVQEWEQQRRSRGIGR